MVNILFPSRIPVQPLAVLLNQRPAGKDSIHAQYAKAWIAGENQAIPTLPSALPEVTHGEGSSKNRRIGYRPSSLPVFLHVPGRVTNQQVNIRFLANMQETCRK